MARYNVLRHAVHLRYIIPIKSMIATRKKRSRTRKSTSFRFRPETMDHLLAIAGRTGWSLTMSCERAVAFAAVHREFADSPRIDNTEVSGQTADATNKPSGSPDR